MCAWANEISPERRTARLKVLMASACFGFLIVSARLVNIQVVQHRQYARTASSQHTTLMDVQARRGRIYDRNGYLLAGNRTVAAFQVYWPQVPQDDEGSVDSLLAVLGERALVRPGSERPHRNQILAKGVPLVEALEIMNSGLPYAVSVLLEQDRTYPMDEMTAGLLGRFTGESSEGLERWFDEDLRGRDGRLYIERSAAGRFNLIDPDADNRHAVDGSDIMLTLDARFQCIVMEELEDALDIYGAEWAAAVLMDPDGGRILAAGSVPVRSESGALAMNRCFQGYHEPGSTFKVVAYAACIEEGVVAEDELFDCSSGFVRVAGDSIFDFHRKGILSRDEVIVHSSNVGTVLMSRALSDTLLSRYCGSFGFGMKTMVEYPGETRGIVPQPGSRGWSGVSSAQMAIGQEVTVTPLQLAMAFGVIANGGTLYYPRLLEARWNGEEWVRERSIVRSRPISPETARIVRRTLRAAVEEGTGASASVSGVAVGGKTGTAERLGGTTDYLSAFVGLVPAENPSLVLAVVIDGPEFRYRWGSASAAPVFSRVVSRIIAVEPELALGNRHASEDLIAGGIR